MARFPLISRLEELLQERKIHAASLESQYDAAKAIADPEEILNSGQDIGSLLTAFFSGLTKKDIEAALLDAAAERAHNLAYKANNLYSRAGIYSAVFSDFTYSVGEHLYDQARSKNRRLKPDMRHKFSSRLSFWFAEKTCNALHLTSQDNDPDYIEYQRRWEKAVSSLARNMKDNDTSGNNLEISAELSPEAVARFQEEVASYFSDLIGPYLRTPDPSGK